MPRCLAEPRHRLQSSQSPRSSLSSPNPPQFRGRMHLACGLRRRLLPNRHELLPVLVWLAASVAHVRQRRSASVHAHRRLIRTAAVRFRATELRSRAQVWLIRFWVLAWQGDLFDRVAAILCCLLRHGLVALHARDAELFLVCLRLHDARVERSVLRPLIALRCPEWLRRCAPALVAVMVSTHVSSTLVSSLILILWPMLEQTITGSVLLGTVVKSSPLSFLASVRWHQQALLCAEVGALPEQIKSDLTIVKQFHDNIIDETKLWQEWAVANSYLFLFGVLFRLLALSRLVMIQQSFGGTFPIAT
eukprot:4882654-Prymnesium_polylepis.2